jgi:spermidine/putrescine transport system substrate-binding protein
LTPDLPCLYNYGPINNLKKEEKTMKKILTLILIPLILLSVIVSVGSSQERKPLRLLTWASYAQPVLVQKFKEETGITVELTISNNEEMISKLRATRGGEFDLVNPSVDRISAVAKMYGIYQPIDYSKVDESQIEPGILAAAKKNTLLDGKSYSVPYVYGTLGLIANKTKVPDVKDYKDVLDPRYNNRVSYQLRRPTLIALGFSLGYDPFSLYNDREAYQKFLDHMEKVLIKGKPIVRNYWETSDALIELFRTGEIWFAMGWEKMAWTLYAENPQIDYVAPTSGPLAWIDTFALPSKSENLEAAYKWINFCLRPQNAALLSNIVKYNTASKDAGKYMDPSIFENFRRCFPPKVKASMHWFPPVPPGLEEMEGKTLDRVRASR